MRKKIKKESKKVKKEANIHYHPKINQKHTFEFPLKKFSMNKN